MAPLQDRSVFKEEVALLISTYGNTIPIDEAVAEVLPDGITDLQARPFGRSAWSLTAKITGNDRDGNSVAYFMKYVPGELGKQQLEGEFVGMTTLRKAAPNFVPKVVGWGELKSAVVKSYFLLVEFKHFVPGLPDPVKLGECVAGLHQSPEAVSPTGQFGFPIQTFDGARLQYVGWESSWAVFFSKMLAEVYRQDIEENGVWTELDAVFQRVQRQLIPRLLGALESDGRSITPVLIHGDMWEGNVGTEADTGNLWTYDCAAYYAHNEMELGIWRAERHELRDKAYRRQYMLRVEPSEPEEEMDDRIRLYSAKTNLIFSACFPGNPSRYHAFNDFVYLLNKYCTEGINVTPKIEISAPNATPVAGPDATTGSGSVPAAASDVTRAEEPQGVVT